ncbi:MAG: pseudouridine synthase [Oscillospiraceae bacterium]
MRLDKFISSQRTDLSRSEVKKLIRRGVVLVNGKKAVSGEQKTDPENDSVTVGGEEIVYRKNIYIMLNKPKGYVCSTKEGACPTVLTLVPQELRRRGLFPAGRLDKDTEGFVLITDDGELAHNMLAPSRHVPKTYFVTLRDAYKEEYAEAFAKGVVIDGDEKCLPAECFPDPDERSCRLVIHEGKFHQVKRMFAAVGNEVVYLKRISIGGLPLDPDLKLGECREILHKDVEKLLCCKTDSFHNM